MLFLLPHAVDRAAERDPERAALRCRGESLSYAGLSRRSNALARTLIARRLERGARIGIYASKGIDAAVAMYGIMKAGAAYVPLDPLAPVARTQRIVESCAMCGIVTEDAKYEAVQALYESPSGSSLAFAVGISNAEGIRGAIPWDEVQAAEDGSPPDVGSTEQDLCYVLYTSGSTGAPKGIMHTHRSALSWAEVAAKTYGFEPRDRLSNHAPLHFDLSTLDYFSAAVAGATTVIIPEEYTKLPASLSKLMADEKLTVFYSVPFALIHLLLKGALESRDLSSLRWVLFGGEPFPTKHLRALMAALPRARFCNVYGPTEVNGCTYYIIPEVPEDSGEPIPIGRPYDNVEALVVDAGDEVSEGEVGELLIRAPTMMRGYWGNAELSERAFHHRTRFEAFDEGFHRTGDLVQALPDGNLRFVGRRDRQVKVRGHRVELDEIEAALASHEDVAESAAYLVVAADERLVLQASVILRDQGTPTDASLQKHIRSVLPWYAIPETIDIVEAFPRTSTGKIDRRRLQEHADAETKAPTRKDRK